MPLQQLQMIGDLKAENEILKEANANLVNRWENYSSVQKFSSSFKKIVTSWIMINFKICNSMNVFFSFDSSSAFDAERERQHRAKYRQMEVPAR